MHKLVTVILLLSCSVTFVKSQDMNNQKLNAIIYTLSDQIEGTPGNWQFAIDSTLFICLTDELHNRMRIISPIAEIKDLTQVQIMDCMEANFHTALDVRYSISDGVMWSAYIHPLNLDRLTVVEHLTFLRVNKEIFNKIDRTNSSKPLNHKLNKRFVYSRLVT